MERTIFTFIKFVFAIAVALIHNLYDSRSTFIYTSCLFMLIYYLKFEFCVYPHYFSVHIQRNDDRSIVNLNQIN